MIKRIILVDDHQLFIDGTVALLSKYSDIEILLATTSVKEALISIDKEKPDLVITDISMPEMSGIEFISILKSKFPTLKIMVLSMHANIQSYKDIDAYLLKETTEDELVNVINKVVENDEKYFNLIENTKSNIHLGVNNVFLTKREKEIIQLIVKEHTTREIADILFISKHTVMTHRKNIFLKLEVANIAGMTKKAYILGVI